MNDLKVWADIALSGLAQSSIDITFTNVVEIIILAFFVYSILLWIKNTRAWTLLKGIMILLVCVSIIYLLRMDTLIYIVSHAINIAIIAVAVIFQPELRRALEQLGEKQIVSSLIPLDSGVTERFSDKTANEIVKASVEMGRAKTGALIVIEQDVTGR